MSIPVALAVTDPIGSLGHGERPGLEWRLVPVSTPLCTDCGGSGQVDGPDGRTWCRLCDASGVLPVAAEALVPDDDTREAV